MHERPRIQNATKICNPCTILHWTIILPNASYSYFSLMIVSVKSRCFNNSISGAMFKDLIRSIRNFMGIDIVVYTNDFMSWDRILGVLTRQQCGQSWFNSQQVQESLLFSLGLRLALDPTHPLTHQALGVLCSA